MFKWEVNVDMSGTVESNLGRLPCNKNKKISNCLARVFNGVRNNLYDVF